MSESTSTTHLLPEDLEVLRRLINHLAPRCGVDLGARSAARRFLDAATASGRSERIDPQCCTELRAMLILLYRLEASSSEDLGIEGLSRLWHQHGEIIARLRHNGAARAN